MSKYSYSKEDNMHQIPKAEPGVCHGSGTETKRLRKTILSYLLKKWRDENPEPCAAKQRKHSMPQDTVDPEVAWWSFWKLDQLDNSDYSYAEDWNEKGSDKNEKQGVVVTVEKGRDVVWSAVRLHRFCKPLKPLSHTTMPELTPPPQHTPPRPAPSLPAAWWRSVIDAYSPTHHPAVRTGAPSGVMLCHKSSWVIINFLHL